MIALMRPIKVKKHVNKHILSSLLLIHQRGKSPKHPEVPKYFNVKRDFSVSEQFESVNIEFREEEIRVSYTIVGGELTALLYHKGAEIASAHGKEVVYISDYMALVEA